jgi:hypothetical protein
VRFPEGLEAFDRGSALFIRRGRFGPGRLERLKDEILRIGELPEFIADGTSSIPAPSPLLEYRQLKVI